MAVVQWAYLTRHVGGAVHMCVCVCVCVCDAQFFQIMLKLRGSTMNFLWRVDRGEAASSARK